MPEATPLSPEAQKAKTAAMQGMRDTIDKTIADNLIKGGKNADEIKTTINLLHQQMANPGIDPATNKKRKYNKITGEDGKITLVPTEKTIEEYGNAAGQAVDEGTQVMGMSWLGKLWIGIKAFFSWMMNGFSGSFTEAYANVATDDIADALKKKLDGMGQEHQEFIKQNNLSEEGKKAVGHAVRIAADLEKKPDDFNLENYLKSQRPATPPKKHDDIPVEKIKKVENVEALKIALKEVVDAYLKEKDKDSKITKEQRNKIVEIAAAKIIEDPNLIRYHDKWAQAIADDLMDDSKNPDIANSLREKAKEGMGGAQPPDEVIKALLKNGISETLQKENTKKELYKAVTGKELAALDKPGLSDPTKTSEANLGEFIPKGTGAIIGSRSPVRIG